MHKKKTHAKLSTMDDSQTAFDGTTGHMEVEAVEYLKTMGEGVQYIIAY